MQVQLAKRPIQSEPSMPNAMPSNPPATERMIASRTNCQRISANFAPIAFLMPISLVRSVTDTSIMFMMPMPPTTSEIPAVAPSNSEKTPVIDCAVCMMSICVLIWKSSWSGDFMPCRRRNRFVIWNCACKSCPSFARASTIFTACPVTVFSPNRVL